MASNLRRKWWGIVATGLATSVVLLGCYNTQPDTSSLTQGPAPLRRPSPQRQAAAQCSYEDSLTGAQVFSMYCAQCHNPRPLSERPFSNYQNVAAHMRVRANLTGKEYAKLMEFLRRVQDVPPPTPPVAPPPKRFEFSQPIPELRNQKSPPQPPGNPGLPPVDMSAAPAAPSPQPIVPVQGSEAPPAGR